MNLILLGPPGAGKGTQASMICSDFNLTHISTGDLLRNETKSSSDLGKEIKSIVEKNKASFAFPSTSVYVEKNL